MKTLSNQKLFSITRQSLLEAGKIILRQSKQKRKVTYKTPLSPVTQTDLMAEKKVVQIISRQFPDHVFLSEELHHFHPKRIRAKSGDYYRWIIDPLDGTVNFVHQIPQSVVSIAVEKNGHVITGGVYDPFRKELFMAMKGKGATCNGRRIFVSSASKCVNALVVTGFPYDRNNNAKEYLALLEPFLNQCADLRRFGAAALDLAWLACGRTDVYFESKLSPWDVAAGWLLVEEAKGKLTDFFGRPFDIDWPIQTLATNGILHSAIVGIIKKHFNA